MVNTKAKQILEEAFKKAMTLLGFPPIPFEFLYERIGDGRFINMEIGAEIDSSNRVVHINEDWANHVYNLDPYDLWFIMSHEVRHFYQRVQINQFYTGGMLKEDKALVVAWIDNFQHYQRNEGGETTRVYHRQPVEVDADAFACFFVMFYGIGKPRIAPDSEDLVIQRLKEIGAQFGGTIEGA